MLLGRLAQLVRAPPSHGGGHGFESRIAHRKILVRDSWSNHLCVVGRSRPAEDPRDPARRGVMIRRRRLRGERIKTRQYVGFVAFVEMPVAVEHDAEACVARPVAGVQKRLRHEPARNTPASGPPNTSEAGSSPVKLARWRSRYQRQRPGSTQCVGRRASSVCPGGSCRGLRQRSPVTRTRPRTLRGDRDRGSPPRLLLSANRSGARPPTAPTPWRARRQPQGGAGLREAGRHDTPLGLDRRRLCLRGVLRACRRASFFGRQYPKVDFVGCYFGGGGTKQDVTPRWPVRTPMSPALVAHVHDVQG
jgi:hypothetical protein